MLLRLVKSSFIFQNVASWLLSRIPPMLEHNVQKYEALRKAFYLTALDKLEGDYLEFGVFTGSSFVAACRIHRRLGMFGKLATRFFGFDSFSGFGTVTDKDKHPFYLDTIFQVNAAKVISNIRKKTKGLPVEIIEGYFDQTLSGQRAAERGITQARIVFIDCDLMEPTRLVLAYVKDALQPGTILIMDDFFSYRGDEQRGVAGAFAAFQRDNPNIMFRRVFEYGYGGVAYIVSKTAAPAPSNAA